MMEDQCEIGWFTMKVHLDELGEDLEKFESVRFLDVFVYEHINVYLKIEYQRTFMRRE